MKYYNHSYRNFGSSPHLYGLLLILAGVFAFVSPYLIGAYVSSQRIWIAGGVATLVGLIITQSFNGILMDYSQNRIMEYFSFFGFKKGEWKQLPKIKSVRIVSVTQTQVNTPNGISPTLSGKVTYYNVILTSENQESVIKLTFQKEKKAISTANELAFGFGVEVDIL